MDGESPVRWTEAVKVLRYEYVPEEKDWACWLSMPIEFQEQDQAIFLKDFTWKAQTYINIYVYIYIYIYIYMCVCVVIYVYMCIYIYIYICVSRYLNVCIYIYI